MTVRNYHYYLVGALVFFAWIVLVFFTLQTAVLFNP